MATIINRSRYVVSVKNRPDLEKEFPHSELARARQYRDELRARGFKPQIAQREDTILVRIRTKGLRKQNIPVGSYEQAEATITQIAADRNRGIVLDYMQGHRLTLAALCERYVKEVCPMHKGAKVETWTLMGFIADSKGELAVALERHQARVDAGEKNVPAIRAKRDPRFGVEWLQKPIAQVLPTDIEQYVHDRIEQELSAATVDRELDLISQVISWSMKTLRIHLQVSPMFGVRRPKYFNERDRKLAGDEEDRLLRAAREEDRIRSRELAIQAHMGLARIAAAQLEKSESTRKRRIAEARVVAEGAIGTSFLVVPFFESLITFLLATAARRGEALSLTWSNTHLGDEMDAFFPETKSGLPRTVPLRRHLIELMKQLPQTHGRVFPISVDAFRAAWYRICERAGIDDFHIHDLRHTGITLIAEAGMESGRPFDVVTLASITGHRDLRMLARYMRPRAGILARRLDEAFDIAKQRREFHKGRFRPRVADWNPGSPPDAGAQASSESQGPPTSVAPEHSTPTESSDPIGTAANRLPI